MAGCYGVLQWWCCTGAVLSWVIMCVGFTATNSPALTCTTLSTAKHSARGLQHEGDTRDRKEHSNTKQMHSLVWVRAQAHS